MDPVTLALGISSLALQLGGAGASFAGASQKAAAQKQQIMLEQKAEEQRRLYMEDDARRKEMEIVRNQQRARAIALTNSTSQGASFGSGLQGGYGQIAGQSGVNMLGVNQNLEIGRNLFGINSQISQQKILQGQGASEMATGQGLSALGSSLWSTQAPLGQFFKGFSNSTPIPNYGNPGGTGGALGGWV